MFKVQAFDPVNMKAVTAVMKAEKLNEIIGRWVIQYGIPTKIEADGEVRFLFGTAPVPCPTCHHADPKRQRQIRFRKTLLGAKQSDPVITDLGDTDVTF
jgi:hypothetical protein